MPTYDFNTIINRLNQLTNFMNSVTSLSKKIFELPESTAGQKSVATWNAASNQTEKFDLTAALNGMYSLTNGITALGNIVRAGADFTFEVGFEWLLNGIAYANAEITRTIDDAGTGNHRIDIAVCDENDDIYIIEGFEVPLATAVVQPPTPPNTLFICSFLITEAVIGDPTPPVITGQDNIPLKKEIESTDLATNDIAGFVTYFNALNPAITITDIMSLVQFFVTDTNETYQLTGIGKGVYGQDSLQITADNVLKFSAGSAVGLDPVLGVSGISDKSIDLRNTANPLRKAVLNPNTVNGPEMIIYEDDGLGGSVAVFTINSYTLALIGSFFGGFDYSFDPFGGFGITDGSNTISVSPTGITVNGNTYDFPSTAGSDKFASEGFVNALLEGIKTKDPVRVATTANITLSGTQTIDGIACIVGDRVLVKNQTDQTENGIYIVSAGAWTRSTDANSATELVSAITSVLLGTANANTTFRQSATSITLGVTNIVWATFGTLVPDADSSTKGKMKLYTVTGTNTDGTITQLLFKTEIDALNTLVTNLGLSKKDNDIIITAGGFTVSQNNKMYIIATSSILTDFGSPTVGQGYSAYVVTANLTINSEVFYAGTHVFRYYDGSAWRTDVMLNTRGGALSGALTEAKSTDIASSTNPSIGLSATGNLVHITGTTTINGFDNAQAGTRRIVVFDGALTLTHSSNLVLPGVANILTTANDVAVFVCEGSSQWRCVSYIRAGSNPTFLDFTSSGQTQLNAKATKPIKQGATQLTGVTGVNVLASLLIPANWMASGDGFEIYIQHHKLNTGVAINYSVYHDTVVNGTANGIATNVSLTSSNRTQPFQRIMSLSGTTLYNCVVVAATTNIPIAATNLATTTLDPTVDNYITITVNPTLVSESCGFTTFYIRKI